MLEVEDAGKKIWLIGATIVLVINNTVVNAEIYTRNSSGETLFELIVCLR